MYKKQPPSTVIPITAIIFSVDSSTMNQQAENDLSPPKNKRKIRK